MNHCFLIKLCHYWRSYDDQHKFRQNCSVEFAESTHLFVQGLVNRLTKVRENFGIIEPEEGGMDIDYDPQGIHR